MDLVRVDVTNYFRLLFSKNCHNELSVTSVARTNPKAPEINRAGRLILNQIMLCVQAICDNDWIGFPQTREDHML